MYKPDTDKQGYTITLFCDSDDSWILPWVNKLRDILTPFHHVTTCFKKEKIPNGDFNFLLGCTKILKKNFLDRHRLNLVVHESDLPEGKGWSPLAWQVLEGKSKIPVTLFEADETLDAGPAFLKDFIKLEGHELLSEIKAKQGEKTIEMIIRFLNLWPDITSFEQKGKESFYDKRTRSHDRLDTNKSLAEQFNHLRIVDNEKYPAWFELNGCKYKLLIHKI